MHGASPWTWSSSRTVSRQISLRATKWGLRHIVTAIGSSCALDTQLEVALRLKFLEPKTATELQAGIDRMQKLLYGLGRDRERRLSLAASGTVLFLAALFRFFS
jgi:hypothetical protein